MKVSIDSGSVRAVVGHMRGVVVVVCWVIFPHVIWTGGIYMGTVLIQIPVLFGTLGWNILCIDPNKTNRKIAPSCESY